MRKCPFCGNTHIEVICNVTNTSASNDWALSANCVCDHCGTKGPNFRDFTHDETMVDEIKQELIKSAKDLWNIKQVENEDLWEKEVSKVIDEAKVASKEIIEKAKAKIDEINKDNRVGEKVTKVKEELQGTLVAVSDELKKAVKTINTDKIKDRFNRLRDLLK